ncbi:MAG: FHA domain-containing protein [Phycisphaeraceae bacterium]|nr:FHA domain-containing protein [Phycisphaeraceae bacterium]
MKISLVMVQADGKAREIPLTSLPAAIGRDEAVKIRIPMGSVSRRHCELVEADDELLVRDLKSSNGTYVNGERIEGSRELVPGDLLAVGPVVFVVRIDGHPKEIDAADSYAAGAVAAEGEGFAGVPSWGGSEGPKTAAMTPTEPPKNPVVKGPTGQPAPGPAKKKDDDDDEDVDFSDLLEGLDLDDDDDEPPAKPK